MSDMMNNRNAYDYAAIVARGSLGPIPYIGPLLAEIVGTLIPNQRFERLADFVRKLEEKIAVLGLAQEELRKRFTSPESIDLFEDSAWQAARALSDERKGHIAALMKNGLMAEQAEHLQYKRLLSMLGEVNDVEILVLKYHSYLSHAEKMEFFNKHEKALPPHHAVIGSSRDEKDKAIVRESYEDHLVRMGLLQGEKRRQRDISSLGRLLLRSIDE